MTGVLLGLAGLIAGLIASVLAGLASSEAKAWLPHLTDRLVRRAARRLPPQERARWQEEALADIDVYSDRPMTALAHAVAVWRSARALAAELRPEPQPARGEDAPRNPRKRATSGSRIPGSAGRLAAWLVGYSRSAWAAADRVARGTPMVFVVDAVREVARGMWVFAHDFAAAVMELIQTMRATVDRAARLSLEGASPIALRAANRFVTAAASTAALVAITAGVVGVTTVAGMLGVAVAGALLGYYGARERRR